MTALATCSSASAPFSSTATTKGVDTLIRGDGIAALERLELNRNNLEGNFRNALASEYPVIERLVGAAYFVELAARFRSVNPSLSGDLQHIGCGFAAFLHDRFANSRYAYFADVAALEWAYHEVLVAADPPAFEPQSLASLPVERYAELRFPALPSARLLRSAFPVLRIWLVNQTASSSEEVIDLEAGPDRVLVARGTDGAVLQSMDAASYEFAQALVDGLTLEQAYDRALAYAEFASAQFD